MSPISRADFMRMFDGASLDVAAGQEVYQHVLGDSQVDQATIGALQGELAQADLDNDGTIRGTSELAALYQHLDNYDGNTGDGKLTIITTADGEPASTVGGAFARGLAPAMVYARSEEQGTTTGARMALGGAASIIKDTEAHRRGIEERGLGTFYGTQSDFAQLSKSQRRELVRQTMTARREPELRSAVEQELITAIDAEVQAAQTAQLGVYEGLRSWVGGLLGGEADESTSKVDILRRVVMATDPVLAEGLVGDDYQSLLNTVVDARTSERLDAWAATEGTALVDAVLDELELSSCITWAMSHVKAAYTAAGQGTRWKQIERTVRASNYRGDVLAKELQKDGWTSMYFNPDAKTPYDGDGEHTFTARQALAGKPYYGIAVDQTLTDYRPTEGSTTKVTDATIAQLERLSEVPFFFGLARGGNHTFVGTHGQVNEFHWDYGPDGRYAMSQLPLELFPWNSGVIMLPPGQWPTD